MGSRLSGDANGNIRNSATTFHALDAQGAIAASQTKSQDYWYGYDALNRVVRQKGALVDTNADGVRDTIARDYESHASSSLADPPGRLRRGG